MKNSNRPWGKCNRPCDIHTAFLIPKYPGENDLQMVKSGVTKTHDGTLDVKPQRFLFDYCITPHSTNRMAPIEVPKKRKRISRLDLLHPSLQGRMYNKQTEVKLEKGRGIQQSSKLMADRNESSRHRLV